LKKLLTTLLSLAIVFSCFAVFAFSASAEGDPEAYLWLKGNSDDNVEPYITFIIDAKELTDPQYTVFCHARFDEGSTGTVFVNEYSFSDYDAAVAGNADNLLNFKDFALCGEATLGEWQDFEYSWNPSQNERGAVGEGCAAITMSIGFWQANGGVAVSELGVKDVDGNVVWSYNFSNGLDLTSDFLLKYNFPEEEGTYWKMVGAEVTDGTVAEESSEETSEEVSAESSVEETSAETSADTPKPETPA